MLGMAWFTKVANFARLSRSLICSIVHHTPPPPPPPPPQSCIQLELNQATGFKYHLLSVASVKCWEVVASSGGKVHGKTLLTGVDTMQDCVNVGSVDYWMRLKLPVTQAAKLYQVSQGDLGLG